MRANPTITRENETRIQGEYNNSAYNFVDNRILVICGPIAILVYI
jgi:hypothetical protein